MLRLIPGLYRWSTARMEHLSSSSNFFFNNRDISFWQVIIDTLSRSSLSGPYRFVVLPNPLQTENGVYYDSGSVFFFSFFLPGNQTVFIARIDTKICGLRVEWA